MAAWWQDAVVYQVYPRSFQDSNNDGIGDLNGIRSRLAYIRDLGASVIWLNPVYATPNADNGYDISDYQAINPEFGTLADFQALLTEAHALGLRIVMDLVVNHTSDQHAWFQAACRSRQAPEHDYYLWHEPVNGGVPNDWGGEFGGSAWTWVPAVSQYYLHLFAVQQPDLNWRNPALRQAIYRMMRWWVEQGVDGFRMDVISFISKPADLTAGGRIANGPHVHEYLREMHAAVPLTPLLTVGETPGVTPQDALQYAGFDTGELNMVFTFQHMGLDLDPAFGRWVVHPWSLVKLKQIMSDWQTALHGRAWNSLYWNNHDQARVVSRFGNDSPQWRVRSAKLLAAVLHGLQGTPYVYQGEELGMTNAQHLRESVDYRDIETLNAYADLVTEQHRLTPEAMLAGMHHASRDNARTPMQWDASANAGFTAPGVTPWLAVNPNHAQINAAAAAADPDSVLAWYRRLIALRKQYPILVEGDYELLLPEDPQVWAYRRHWQGQTLTVVANFGTEPVERAVAAGSGQLLLHNYPAASGPVLQGYEVRWWLD